MNTFYAKLSLTIALLVNAVSASAQEAITDTTLLSYSALFIKISYYRVNYTYESVDHEGNPVTLSAAMVFPEKVFTHKDPVTINGESYDASGLMLSNHYTITRANEAPTQTDNMSIEGPMAGMGPHFITISPDGYGFGTTVDKPQAYLMADITARNNIDAVKSARRLLSQMGYTYGDLFTQIGYSQGGHSAMAVQRYFDTHPVDAEAFTHIDYTLCGDGPYDIAAMLDTLLLPSARYRYPCAMPLIVQGQIDGAGVDVDYSECFRKPLDTKAIEWLNSKKFNSTTINDSIFKVVGGNEKTGVLVDSIMCTENFTRSNTRMQPFFDALEENTLVAGWKPNEATRFYVYHSADDEIVPYFCLEHLADFLRTDGGVGDDRLETYKSSGLHEQTAVLFVINSISHLLDLESDYLKGIYTPASLDNPVIDVAPRLHRLSGWYRLDGQRLSAQPSKPGLYIHNGRKVVVK
ncbi:MAG: hypothetical protein K6C10_09440 [Prevotella sp.]|nr:hypothetical protein [Prevotella sp.]